MPTCNISRCVCSQKNALSLTPVTLHGSGIARISAPKSCSYILPSFNNQSVRVRVNWSEFSKDSLTLTFTGKELGKVPGTPEKPQRKTGKKKKPT